MDVGVSMAELRRLQSPAAPNLPLAPTEYTGTHFDILNNVLRLYFNRLDQILKALFGLNGGQYLQNPHVAASDSTDQYAVTNTPTLVVWDTFETNSGFTPTANSVIVSASGIYKIDYSLQFVNTSNVEQDILVWLKVNGVDVPRSASKFTIRQRKSAGVPSYLIAYSSVEFEVFAGDEIQLYWATSLAYNPVGPVDGVYMESIAAQTSPYIAPAAPSAVGSITFVSALAA